MAFNPLNIFKKKENRVIDLGKLHKTGTTEKSLTEEGIGLGFLGNLASASTSTSTISKPVSSSVNNLNPERLERFGRRLDKVLERIELLERKLERVEHRLDIS